MQESKGLFTHMHFIVHILTPLNYIHTLAMGFCFFTSILRELTCIVCFMMPWRVKGKGSTLIIDNARKSVNPVWKVLILGTARIIALNQEAGIFLNDYIIIYCLCRQVKNAAMLSDLSLWNSLPWLHLATYLILLQFVLVVNILQLVILMVLQLHILSVTFNIRMYLEWFHFSFSSEFFLMVLGSFGTLTLAMKYLITQSVCSLSSLGNLALIIQCH